MGWRPDGSWDEPVKLVDVPFRPDPELVRRSLAAARWLETTGSTPERLSPLWAKHEAAP